MACRLRDVHLTSRLEERSETVAACCRLRVLEGKTAWSSYEGGSRRIALVGAGAFGRFCLDAYRKCRGLSVVAVIDPSTDALHLAKPLAPHARFMQDWGDLKSSDEVEAVHVATPPFLRANLVDAALLGGMSVFCEKPLALSLEEADCIISASRASGVALGVNYVMRHLPAYHMLVDLVQTGLFGELRTISFQNFAQAVPPDLPEGRRAHY